jgi:HlyD family secretion protein
MRNKIIQSLIFVAVLAAACGIAARIFFPASPKRELKLYGNVDVRLVDIGFRVSGKIENLFSEEGDLVKEGALLCTLEKNPYDSRLEEALANVEAIQLNLSNAEKQLKRREELVGIGGVSVENLENAEFSRDQLMANLSQAEATLAVRMDELSYTESYAPNTGIILTRIREPGSVINAGDPVYTLSLTSPVWIRAFVDEVNLGDIEFGMQVQVQTDIQRGKTYKGTIGFISPVAEFTPKTVQSEELRTDLVYRLRVYVENPDADLKQGMPVTVIVKK